MTNFHYIYFIFITTMSEQKSDSSPIILLITFL